MAFRLTYSTMFDPPEELHVRFEAALALEVGKNSVEALGEAQETADFFAGYARELERNAGYDHALPDDPLTGGPVVAAIVTGNTVVLKGASDTPWAGRLLADCIRDAGFPPGATEEGRARPGGETLLSAVHADGHAQ
ncbi:MAG: hypothetical protein A2V74_01490 [Acidobacteria bacterium RBG_16_70_10]|nr:MAG: hypothetical protein A2V74_01490 [Acidobacteria bacterium RBG_16_70_10]